MKKKALKILPKPARVKHIPVYYPMIVVNGVDIYLGEDSDAITFIDELVSNTMACGGTTINWHIAEQLLEAKLIEVYPNQKDRYRATPNLIDNHQKIIDALSASVRKVEEY